MANEEGVFLTGGTGLLGSHVCDRLSQARIPVRALCRPSSSSAHLEASGATLVAGDVRAEPSDISVAMGSVSTVVHSAAAVYPGWPWPDIQALNVHGARRTAEAAARNGVRHFVHVSSVAVYGPKDGPVTEDDPLDCPLSDGDLYARSKREAEFAVQEVARETGLPLTILRPAVVYGERDRHFVPRLRRMLRWRLVPVPGGATAPLPVVYAGNVADCVARIVECGAPSNAPVIYNLAYDDPLSLRALLRGLAQAMGARPPRILPVPEPVAAAGATVTEWFLRLRPGTAAVPPLRRSIRLATRGNPYRSERVREDLGWRPPFAAQEALERTGLWVTGQSHWDRALPGADRN